MRLDSGVVFLHISRMRITRRKLVGHLTLAVAAAAGIPGARTQGAGQPRLDVKDPAAIALGYVESANDVDARKFPEYAKGSNCENCLQLQGTGGNNYRPCSLFPGKLVAVAGWCKGWTPEM